MKICFYSLLLCLIWGCDTSTPPQEEKTTASAEAVVNNTVTNKPTEKQEIDTSKVEEAPAAKPFEFPYDLKESAKSFKMPGDLQEISGISYLGNNKLACIQDEKGNIYHYDLKKEEVTKKTDFGKSGDYEGIALNEKQAFILRSDGTIFTVDRPLEKESKGQKLGPYLQSENDGEGLAIHPKTGKLLLACKGPHHLAKSTGGRMVFEINPNKANFPMKTALEVSPLDIKVFIEANDLKEESKSFEVFFDKKDWPNAFQTSDLAIHPETGNWYLISTALDKFLLVYSPQGQILHLAHLSRKTFPQPEGICFDESGNLYIATEGKAEKGKIVKFELGNR